MEQLDFEVLFKYSIMGCKFTGTNPYQAKNWSWLLRFLIGHGSFTLINILHVYTVFSFEFNEDYFTRACSNFSLLIAYGYLSSNYLAALIYQKSFAYLKDTMKKDYEVAKMLTPEEQKVVLEYARKGNFVVKMWILAPGVTFTSILLPPVIITLYYAMNGQHKYAHAVEIFVPGTSDEYRESFYNFLTSFLLLVAAFIYGAPSYTGMCPLGPIFMLHASGQLELLRLRLLKLYPKDGSITTHQLEQRVTNLAGIAKQLQDIYDFVDHIKMSHKTLLELTLRGTAFIVPVLCYQIIKTLEKGELRIEFPLFLAIGGIVLSAIPCYYGNILMTKSEDMTEALYFSGWETQWDKHVRSSLLVMMTRTTRVVAIDTVFKPLSLETLTDTFRLAYTLFNAMNTLLD